MLKAALLFFMMRICNRSCYTIVRDPVAAIQASFRATKKYSATAQNGKPKPIKKIICKPKNALVLTSASFVSVVAQAQSRQHLSIEYNCQRHSAYSLCYPLERKALLCSDDPCMQVIFSLNKLSGNIQSTCRILPVLHIGR